MAFSRMLYGGTIFLGAFLLFLVEPMAAKQLLPLLGGSSAVWITCLVFFQVVLFLGYLYAHWLTRKLEQGPGLVHTVFLGAGALLLFLHPGQSFFRADLHPTLTIFAGLGLGIGMPFLALSSTSPLLQVWLARREGIGVPYKLFALSNFGSLLALAAYPIWIEPRLSLSHQWICWRIGFLVYLVLCLSVAWRTPKTPKETPEAREENEFVATSVSPKHWLLWFLLPAAASVQLCAVTSFLSQNIAAIPLLWVVPLAVYLLTFILAFEAPILYRRPILIRLLVVFLASLGYILSKTNTSLPILIGISFFLIELFLACYFCHAELYALRPKGVAQATRYYLMIVAGGAAGTCFVGILSPLLFSANYDLAISALLVAALAFAVTWGDGWAQRLLWATGTVAGIALVVMLHIAYQRDVLVMVRNFYGVLRVKQTHTPAQAVTARTLVNGSIDHGTEWFAEEFRDRPTSYYAEDSGVGLALRYCCGDAPKRVGVIGLGAGTLATYGHPGDSIRFYEINPLVERLARHFFTFLKDSQSDVRVVDGDARLSLGAEAPQGYQVLVVDAFSGDAIPVHLLTREAMELYQKHLANGGVIAFHISNQYLNLAPVVVRLAQNAQMQSRVIHSFANESKGEFSATWVLVSNNQSFFNEPEIAHTVAEHPQMDGVRLWTDDYSSLLPILRH
jgi:hypothetical protein